LLNQAQAALFLVHPHRGAVVLHEPAGTVQRILLQVSPQPPTLVGLPVLLETTERKVLPMSVPSSRLRTRNRFASFASKSLIFDDANDLLTDSCHRHQHSVDATYKVFGFSHETGTSSLRAHLMKFHLGQWVDGCDQFKIPITAEISKRAVESYRASKGQSSSQSTSLKERPEDIREYSYEAFVDAITQFIIVDDQVRLWLPW